jgi:hypothetical protein
LHQRNATTGEAVERFRPTNIGYWTLTLAESQLALVGACGSRRK